MRFPLAAAVAQPTAVIPAQAGIHLSAGAGGEMDPRLRGDDTQWEAGIVGQLAVPDGNL